MKHFLNTLLIFLIFAFALQVLASMPHALAAEIVIDSDTQEIRTGDQFEVGVFIDTEDGDINAVEGRVVFPEELLELKEIRSGNSVINFWVEDAHLENGNEIKFSGIVPGGYVGRGLVFSIIFQSKKDGMGLIETNSVRVLRNDGMGTEVSTTVSNLSFFVSRDALAQKSEILGIKDINPPEPFEPTITQDPTVFGGKYFLVFATQDKGSGIDRYEVREGKGDFAVAESPYLLRSQGLHKEITVKAVDKNGNERVIILPPAKPWALYKKYLIPTTLILIIMVFMFTIRKIIKKRTKHWPTLT